MRLWEHRTDPSRKNRSKTKKKNKHPNSDYWLSNFMVAKQDGKPLVGQLSGPKGGPKTPYYRHKHRANGYESDSILNRMFPMIPLHQELCRLFVECLADVPDLRQRLTRVIEEQRAHTARTDETLEALEAEREDIRERTQWISRQSKKAREDAEPEMRRLDARRDELDVLIAQRQSNVSRINEPVERVVDRAILRCQRLANELPSLPATTMRDLSRILITRIEADFETKDVSLSIALPKFVLEARKKPAGEKDVDQTDFVAMCLGRNSRSSVSSETHQGIVLAAGLCEYERGQRDVCYHCRRMAA
jgi:hypothetical protein